MKRILLVLVLVCPAWSRSPAIPRHRLDPLTETLRHRYNEARQPELQRLRSTPGPVAGILPDAGSIAVVDDGDGVFLPATGFTLDGRTLQFQPGGTNASQYTYSVTASRFDADALASGTRVPLGDDAAVQVTLPFAFPFYGQRHTVMFIHSDGNISFSVPDAASTERDLDRLVTGPPRVAPLFMDIDPTQPDAAVSYVSSGTRIVITWNNVPLYADAPGPRVPRQTFQAVLYDDGRIEFSYRGINIQDTIVGIAPGGATRTEQVSIVDFSAASTSAYTTAVVQEFTSEGRFDFVTLMQKFYRNHDDSYDFMVLFDTVDRDQGCAFTFPIRNWVRGIGLRVTNLFVEEFDATSVVGSAGRLQNFVYMGPIGRYPADPAQLLPATSGCGRNTALSILGQEAGHRFLAYPLFVDPATGRASPELLGRDLEHWSFYFNSDASLVEGNEIEDKGQGASPRFETKQIVQRYGPFDQYLMGLRAPEDVPTSFLVRQASIDFPRSHPPQAGLLFDGTRVDITVPMIVAAEGRRAPDHTVSPKQFRFAFVFLVRAGTTPSQADIDKLERMRSAWEGFFRTATGDRATAETRLGKQLQLSVWPAAGLIQGRTVTASVTLGNPAAGPLTVNLSASGGVSVPPSVTVPAGSRSADFQITGNNPGVFELTVRGPDDSYETARATLQVRGDMSGLRLERLWNFFIPLGLIVTAPERSFSGGAGLPLTEALLFRVRDENYLPYPGLQVAGVASGGGSVPASELLTDARGWVRVPWRLDPNPGVNTLTVSLVGQPDVSARAQVIGAAYQPARRRDPR